MTRGADSLSALRDGSPRSHLCGHWTPKADKMSTRQRGVDDRDTAYEFPALTPLWVAAEDAKP